MIPSVPCIVGHNQTEHRPTDSGYWEEVRQAWHPLIPTDVFAAYWIFAVRRQQVYFDRIAGIPPPWGSDAIIQNYRFTNCYRASDRVSQYLIRNVIYPADLAEAFNAEDWVFRILLFKAFNRISTWQLLEKSIGEITWRRYDFTKYADCLEEAMGRGESIFSAAYIMPSGKSAFGYQRKHRNFLRLIELFIQDGTVTRFSECRSLKDLFRVVQDRPLLGPFLGYQYAVDLNYWSELCFDEGDFVVAGPGAADGIAKCFHNANAIPAENIIMLMYERQQQEFDRLGMRFTTLWGRVLQPVDCQNLFCELGKYARIAYPEIHGTTRRKRIKQIYRGADAQVLPPPVFPPRWELDTRIAPADIASESIMKAQSKWT